MFNKNINTRGACRSLAFFTLCFLVVTGGCRKEQGLAEDPYQSSIIPLVKFLPEDPSPASGSAGTKVTVFIDGLQGKDTSDFQMFINQERAKIVSVEDSAVTVIVPASAGSGAFSVVINGQNYFGPVFNVVGKVRIDPTFNPGTGINPGGVITDIVQNSDNTFFLVGGFNDYNNKATLDNPINDIVKISNTGEFKTGLKSGKAITSGIITRMLQIGSSYFIAGSFNNYNDFENINNITRIQSTAQLDTSSYKLINITAENDPSADTAFLPSFNGGTNTGLSNIFYDGKGIVAIGDFNQFTSYYYERSTKGAYIQDRFDIATFARMSTDGVMDSTYNVDPSTMRGYKTINGVVNSSVQLSDKSKIVIAGNFSSFGGHPAGRIAMLDENGRLDQTFNAGGSGADGDIIKITYNEVLHKMMIIGNFRHYNGVEANGIAMLNEDGSMDNNFQMGSLVGGVANYAALLSNGLVLVTGSFSGYGAVYRQGMLLLNQDGSLAAGYNNMGSFVGQVHKVYESRTGFGTFGVILIGAFNMVDNKSVNGIVKLEIQ